MDYEEFFSEDDVATFKRVTLGTMRLAAVGRDVAAQMVGGQVTDEGKEFVSTVRGTFRLAPRHNTDNSTERRDLDQRGVRTVVMSDAEQMAEFFAQFGLDDGAYENFRGKVKARLS